MTEPAPNSIPEPLLPPLAVAVYIACSAGAGALANCAVLAALLRRSNSGLLTIVIQLAISDLILLGGSAGFELWSQNAQTWPFGTIGCMVYRGLDVFTSTATLYLTLTIGLHTLATINIEERAAVRRAKRICEEEIRSSRHSLVAESDSSTPPRTMNIDYRIVDTGVPVGPPSLFVWVLAVSLSVPEFVLATTIRMNNSSEICSFVEPSYRINMHSMLAVFNLFLPVIILCMIGILTVIKLKTKITLSNVLNNELESALKLSFSLVVTYILLCLPRSVLSSYFIYSLPADDQTDILQLSLHSRDMTAKLNMATTCAYITAALFRPLLCVSLIPTLRRIFKFDRTETVDI